MGRRGSCPGECRLERGTAVTTPQTASRFALLRELFDLARAQRRALEADALDRFESLLDEREAIILRLQTLSEDAAADLPPNVIPFPAAPASEAEDILALDTLIRGVLEHDRHNEEMLVAMRESIRAALPALEAGRRTAARYGLQASGSRFIDHTS